MPLVPAALHQPEGALFGIAASARRGSPRNRDRCRSGRRGGRYCHRAASLARDCAAYPEPRSRAAPTCRARHVSATPVLQRRRGPPATARAQRAFSDGLSLPQPGQHRGHDDEPPYPHIDHPAHAVWHLRGARGDAPTSFRASTQILDEHGLAAALRSRLQAVETRAGLAAEFECSADLRLAPDQEHELYRLAQEALSKQCSQTRTC